jgi:branched-chain amino acid transport system substrate-binding protein
MKRPRWHLGRVISQMVLLLAAISVITPSPLAASSSDEKGATIKIGFIVPLTGVAAMSGQDMVNGITLYLEQIHSKIGGRRVELIVENDGGSPATALQKVQKLVEQDKVQVLDGILQGNVGYAVAPFLDKYHVPMLYPVTAGDDLTQREHHHWLVRTGWSASQASHPFGEWVYKTLGYKRVVIFGVDYAFGWEVAGGFQKSFEEAGGKVIQKIWVPLGFIDFAQQIKEIRKDADAVFFSTTSKPAEVIPDQYKKFGPGLPVIAGGTSFDESILRHLGDEALGGISPSIYSAALDTPANKSFVKAYRAKYGVDPSYYAESCYTSGLWIHKAIDSLHGDITDKEKLLTALKRVKLQAPRGPVKLDDRGNPIQNIYVRKVEKVDGKLQNKVTHTFANVSQFWKYDPSQYLKQPVYSREFPPCKYCSTD